MDIDLDYSEMVPRKVMQEKKELITSRLLKYNGLFDESEQGMLRKCVAFYLAVGLDTAAAADLSMKNLWEMPQRRIKADLAPVLHNGDFFALQPAREMVSSYLIDLLQFTEEEKTFLDQFKEKQYHPQLLFDDMEIQKRLVSHPMAIWKCRPSREPSRDDRG